MITNIIKAFERKFNKFAESTDAFTSRFICDEDSAIGTLCFRNFNVEFEYTLECGGIVEKSGLNIILDFSKRTKIPLRCMMYDIIALIDKDNFNCWFYCFIENEERMELCFDKLSGDFAEVLPKIKKFTNSTDNIAKLRTVVDKNIKTATGINFQKDFVIDLDMENHVNPDEAYDYFYNLFFGFQQCAFASNAYRDFLAGDFKKALRKYEKKKNRLIYEDRLIEYMRSETEPSPVFSKEYECLKDGLKEYSGSSGFIPFFISWWILLIPCFAFFSIIYFSICHIMYHSAIYATQFELYNVLNCLMSAFLCSIASGYFLQDRIYKKLFRKKYERKKDYDDIFNNEKSTKRIKILIYLVYILSLVTIFLFANMGLSFDERGVRLNESIVDISGSYYTYNEIESLKHEDDFYVIYFDDGKRLELVNYIHDDDIREKLVTILDESGIETNTE